ncbi:hypothetical protein HWB51_gp032 [Mycobacterium phage Cuke]|uniref:Uncharacterized protein n=1 Tax=Mycobacterium phage Cuke TaxID=2079417 RepID=A0A2L1IWR4_9CAUD|nr:hypothetical protein HWB51_gp032 [Mycobacterium phage Cuke]AVD99650.1 hypothetical protein SEA_CUKE_32 [Mycobacterium phage Cuke]
MRSRESKEQLTEQLSLFGLKPTKSIAKQKPGGVVIELLEIAEPPKQFINYGRGER